MKKFLWLLVSVLLIQGAGFTQTVYDDNYVENPNYLKGMEYMESSQYSSAITEFKKALRTNPSDDSALIGISNAYNLRAKYYNDNLKEPEKALIDVKSALFFNKYCRQTSSQNAMQAVFQMEKNLKMLETALKKQQSPSAIMKIAKEERNKGEFAAAAFDYHRLVLTPEYKAEANNALGDIYKIFNRPDKAVTAYQNALESDNDNTALHLKLARAYEATGDFNSALKEYSYTLDTSNEREDILNSLEKIWQKKVDENPNDAEAHANLGVVFQKEKRYNEALIEYRKAESLNPNNINTKVNIGTLYQELKKYDMAINVYDYILQSQPKNTDILIYKAQCLKELGKKDEAVSIFKSALAAESKNPAAKKELFALLKETLPTQEMLDMLYKNVVDNPQDSSAYYEFAYELHKAGKIDDAITYYTQSVKSDKNNIDAYLNLSQCYRQQKKYSEAYSVIKEALALQPKNAAVKEQADIIANEYTATVYNSAASAYEDGKYEKAIELYSKIQPQTVEAVLGIAASYQAMGNNEKAIENYKSAMSLDSDNADIPYYIAVIYANTNDLDKADEYVKKALEKNPKNAPAKELSEYLSSKHTENLLEQAVKIYEEEKYADAIKLFDNILKINPNQSTVYYYRALSYDALKNYANAINDYKEAVRLAPNMNIAYYLIAVDYDNLENYKESKAFYQKYINTVNDDNEYKQYAQSRINEIGK